MPLDDLPAALSGDIGRHSARDSGVLRRDPQGGGIVPVMNRSERAGIH